MALPRLVDTALEGMGASLPPHVSIQGNAFTLIDASGAEQLVTFQGPDGKTWKSPFFDVVIADMGGLSKQYYGADWTPDSSDPPKCFSDDGVVPSPMASERQARTCAECPQNVRGSAISKLSGTAIKACRDQKQLAVIPIAYPGMLFRFTLTPGSFNNFRAYVQKFNGQQFDIPDVVTRLAFAENQNGVLTFEATAHAPDQLKQQVTAARLEHRTDVFVGRGGPAALPAPVMQFAPQIAAPPASVVQAAVQQPAPFVPAPPPSPFGVATAGVMAPPPNPSTQSFAPTAAVASPSEPATPARRTRRTKAEMAAARGEIPGANGQILPPAGAAPTAAPQAPFPHPGQAPTTPVAPNSPLPIATGATPGPQFGISPGVAPNPELAAMLEQTFGKPSGT